MQALKQIFTGRVSGMWANLSLRACQKGMVKQGSLWACWGEPALQVGTHGGAACLRLQLEPGNQPVCSLPLLWHFLHSIE